MKVIRLSIILLFLLGINELAFSQSQSKLSEEELIKRNSEADKLTNAARFGTFQFVLKADQQKEVFTDDELLEILIQVEKARNEKELVYINAGKFSRIKVLPKEVVYSPGFKAVSEYTIDK